MYREKHFVCETIPDWICKMCKFFDKNEIEFPTRFFQADD